jgi:CRP-like cAMP-binding protein
MVGRNGIIGAAAAFGVVQSDSTMVVQLAGAGWSIDVEPIASLANSDDRVRAVLFRNERFLLMQAQQTAGCNARHPIPQRLASWLLRLRDIAGEGQYYLTQEYLAQMLGVQRAAVSGFASELQDKGLIQYRRGNLSILDVNNLKKEACECYGMLHQRYQALFQNMYEARPSARRASV